MPARAPRLADLTRNYPLEYRIRHRKGLCAHGETFGYVGWLRLVEGALRLRYWEVLPGSTSALLSEFFEELDRASLVDDGAPDEVSIDVAELVVALDALLAFAADPPLAWRHELDIWEGPVLDTGELAVLLPDLRPHTTCGARAVFLKRW